MKEYIEREIILKTPPFTKCVGDLSEYAEGYLDCVEDACEAVKKTPAADVEPVRHGEWKPTSTPSYFGGVIYECSLCGAKDGDHSSILGIYCWRCGAKMDGGNKK